ncbi:S1 RNA-binding domain-containing protein, partial [candidate division WWE3 bacterium]|nr:S1 RNA-binding domain-containing protein [candidate division WWE3 bacterium]
MAEHPMQKLLEKHKVQVKSFKPGDLVEGTVVSVSHKEILVDVGAKSEGIISHWDLEDSILYKNLKEGDTIMTTVVQAENDQGYIVLSLKKAEKEKKWKDLAEAVKTGSTFEVKVLEYNKGGLLVDCLGLRGFVPLSHLDKGHFSRDDAKFAAGSEAELKEKLQVLSGRVLKVKVIEVDKDKNRLVLSEKEAKPGLDEDSKRKKLDKIKEGDILDGVVTGVMPFGAFIDVDGLDGLVHISEVAWEKVSDPNKYFTIGEKVKVLVLGIEKETGKLALSVKRLTKNPWENVE